VDAGGGIAPILRAAVARRAREHLSRSGFADALRKEGLRAEPLREHAQLELP
jgi:hypothetical protein